MLLQALHVQIEMKNVNLQITLRVQNGVGTLFPLARLILSLYLTCSLRVMVRFAVLEFTLPLSALT